MLFHPMDFVILIAFVLSIWSQFKVKRNFNKWSEIGASSGLSDAEVIRKLLDNKLYHVPIEVVSGRLTDYYNPTM